MNTDAEGYPLHFPLQFNSWTECGTVGVSLLGERFLPYQKRDYRLSYLGMDCAKVVTILIRSNPNAMNALAFRLEYEWVPFKFNGTQLIFLEYENNDMRLTTELCSHSGPAIYKWEGNIEQGEYQGKNGILIGETDDIRARLNQYKSGTQENGTKYWRDCFLRKGRIHYWVMRLNKCVLNEKLIDPRQFERKNFRLVMEQLLVMELLCKYDRGNTWVVNRMQ